MERGLTINQDTGVSEWLDPRNPDIVYAGTYERRRAVGQMMAGGPDGGIFKSNDGGKTWTKLTSGCRSTTSAAFRSASIRIHRIQGRVYANVSSVPARA